MGKDKRIEDIKPLTSFLTSVVSEIPNIDMGEIRKAQRVQQVRDMWASLVEQVFLDHTNSVYIFEKNNCKEMHVYVDESIYAAELNGRRELIKLECFQRFGELIDNFYIHVSRGKYKKQYPYRKQQPKPEKNPLNTAQLEYVHQTAEKIKNPTLRESFEKAMKSDLERNS